MAVATILDIWKCPIVDPDDLHGRVIPLFLECLRVGNTFLELFFGYLVKVNVKPDVKYQIKKLIYSIQFSLFPAHINISYNNDNIHIMCRKVISLLFVKHDEGTIISLMHNIITYR